MFIIVIVIKKYVVNILNKIMLYGYKVIVKEILFCGCFFVVFCDLYFYFLNVNDVIFVSIL